MYYTFVMKILVLGATGATGRLVVDGLLNMNQEVKAVVRSKNKSLDLFGEQKLLEVIEGSILSISDNELNNYLSDVDAVVSCLGHNLSFKGILFPPRRLVRDAVKKVDLIIKKQNRSKPLKYILMNTTGNKNRDLDEKRSIAEHLVIGLIRMLLPPHSDNEKAADYLRTVIGKTDKDVSWVAVRPDTLVDDKSVTSYTVHPSPIRSAIFDPGKTSRINVSNFMVCLLTDEVLWSKWKGQMPVIYNG